MKHWSTDRMAKLAIGVQLLILIRLPAEVFRLKYIHGNAFTLAAAEPFIGGELVTAICAAVALLLYFWNKPQGTIWMAAGNVAMLVVFKVFLM
jgi:hypothetical protein